MAGTSKSNVQENQGLSRRQVEARLAADGVVILPPADVLACMDAVRSLELDIKTTILDPWYNKGLGGVREDYEEFILQLLHIAGAISDHVFLWGFPEIIAPFVTKIPEPLSLVSWLTWYYKNSPSVIRGWRSSQNACLHLSRPGARLYPEHFLNAAQQRLREQGKLRYMPGPTSVIEEPLIVGFVGRREKTGHPSQKPVAVFEKLILMTTAEGDLVFDPMCGSGTTGDAVLKLGRRAILSDISEDYTRIAESRLGISRLGAVGGVKPHRAKRCPEESAGALFDQHAD
jgi:site-specific DNA-methyltransferase (adenine-specific)